MKGHKFMHKNRPTPKRVNVRMCSKNGTRIANQTFRLATFNKDLTIQRIIKGTEQYTLVYQYTIQGFTLSNYQSAFLSIGYNIWHIQHKDAEFYFGLQLKGFCPWPAGSKAEILKENYKAGQSCRVHGSQEAEQENSGKGTVYLFSKDKLTFQHPWACHG